MPSAVSLTHAEGAPSLFSAEPAFSEGAGAGLCPERLLISSGPALSPVSCEGRADPAQCFSNTVGVGTTWRQRVQLKALRDYTA